MAVAVIMPKLGLTMEEGTVIAWLARAGEPVEAGQPLLEVETDKVVVEVESPGTGVLGPALIEEGAVVPVGAVLAHIYGPDEDIPAEPPEAVASPPVPVPTPHPGPSLPPPPPQEQPAPGMSARSRPEAAPHRAGRRFSSPRARKRARALGLEWRALSGSGPRGRVVERDVLAAASGAESLPLLEAAPAIMPAPQTPAPAPPAFQLGARVHMAALLDADARIAPWVEQQTGLHLTLADWLVLITAAALAEVLPQRDGVDIGVYSFNDAGLTTSLVRDARRKSLSEIATERQSHRGASSPAAITVVDLSARGIDALALAPSPSWPLMLALGGIDDQGWVRVTLSGDGFDWQTGVDLLERIKVLLEAPYLLLTEL